MDITVLPQKLSGTVKAIPSKSQAHRALICAALANSVTTINCESESEDISATIACLRALGANIERTGENYTVTPLNRHNKNAPAALHCGESGSTLRFLIPVVCALGLSANFMPQGRLPQRPLSPLYEELVKHGCVLSPQGSVPFSVSGQLTSGIYKLNGGVSSQFISGLLFALPLLNGNSELLLSGKVESLPYIEMTTAMLKTFGINIAFENNTFYIRGNQVYSSPHVVDVEGDWSNAAFWLGAGALSGEGITCTGLNLQSPQGDKAIINILRQFGATVHENALGIQVIGGQLCGIHVNATDIPDLVPLLAVVGTAAEGETVISGAQRLRIKESDRLAAVCDVLGTLGADIAETADGLVIHGGAKLRGGEVSSWGDHRIAMAAAVAAQICTAPVVIKHAQAVNKSYPRFFEDLERLAR